jgi:hypothetical protein
VRRFLAEFRDRTKVIDLKELLSAEHGFSTFAVGATLTEVSTHKWQILRAIVELRRVFLPDKSGHDRSARSLEASQQVLDRRHQFVAFATPIVLEDSQAGGVVLVFGIEASLDSFQFQQFGEIQRPLKAFVDQFMIAVKELIGVQRSHLVNNRLCIVAHPWAINTRRADAITAAHEGRVPRVRTGTAALVSPNVSELGGSISTRFVADASPFRRQAFGRRHSFSALEWILH